ncbi:MULTISPECIES: hypothetical protein [unclassified Rhodococcus (in: high G+C Gram-positive bacteria)]|uniref:hypothetical protein n=1 Tax=unclassified Rhodococcus (in: high G+C Gram-positive bacteria) TaxID=192944 RepID=UPI001639BBD1|nr:MULTISPECIES: hypothetical protein [unclassified Rhodococcus (in: high G+C Gram-positive bacteria)]MBC2641141.1 hypothetical protein [Rhodococcus sp. 3A]MBC2894114.1 hypothetical protein [Rhodococcus sp. 4CII]
MLVATGLVLGNFILPAVAISWVVPAEKPSLTTGVMRSGRLVIAVYCPGSRRNSSPPSTI